MRYDAIVVGAGAMGSATAWQLARRGCSVLLLEQFEPGHARGSSHGPTRIFRLAYRDRRYLRLALEALPLWRELEAEAGETLLEQDGQLDHGAPEAIGAIASNLRAAGRACEELSPAAARERWPGMRFDRSVVFSPEGGRCYAQATVRALLRLCAARGVDVRFGARVARVVPDGEGAHVTAPDGEYHARAVVVAAGGWVRKLVGSGARGLPELRVTREQPAHFALRDASLCYPAFIHHVHAGVPAHLGFATYGLSTPELGVKVGEHGIGIVVDPDEAGPGPDPTRLERLSRYVAEWLPGLDPRPVESTPCLYTSTPDEHFVLDRRGPIVVCSACSGHGFKFTPVIGRIAADLALGAEQPEPAWRLREGEPAAG